MAVPRSANLYDQIVHPTTEFGGSLCHVIGEKGVGKTALIGKMVRDGFAHPHPPIVVVRGAGSDLVPSWIRRMVPDRTVTVIRRDVPFQYDLFGVNVVEEPDTDLLTFWYTTIRQICATKPSDRGVLLILDNGEEVFDYTAVQTPAILDMRYLLHDLRIFTCSLVVCTDTTIAMPPRFRSLFPFTIYLPGAVTRIDDLRYTSTLELPPGHALIKHVIGTEEVYQFEE